CDGVVARFEHQRSLVHPSCHEVTIYRLADKPSKASREGRATKPHVAPQLRKSPRVPGIFVDHLKRPAYVPIRNCAEPPPFARTKGFYPTAQDFDKKHLGHSREHRELAGALERCLGHHPL